MAVAEISVVPLGTGTPSLSDYVAGAIRVLQGEPGIKYEVTAMATIIEADMDKLLSLAGRMHQTAFEAGAKRVVTTIKIDDRRDKPLSISGKLDAVRAKLGGKF